MNRKYVKLKVKQNNLLENKNTVIFNGIAQIDTGDNYKIYYQEIDKTSVKLIINENVGILRREGEVTTEIKFNLKQESVCKISTSVGNIFMDVKTLKISLEKDKLFLYYELLEAGATVGKFQLRLEWENEQN